MNTRDIPIGVLGVGLLYVAYLLQNNRIRLGFEGFQNASPQLPQGMDMDKIMREAALKVQKVCAGPQDIDTIVKAMKELATPPPASLAPAPSPPASPPPAPSPTPSPPAAEGFQSGGNPYNAPSPSNQQAFEFRLGRKSLTDEVLRFMN
jgi:hypothetical protein